MVEYLYVMILIITKKIVKMENGLQSFKGVKI